MRRQHNTPLSIPFFYLYLCVASVIWIYLFILPNSGLVYYVIFAALLLSFIILCFVQNKASVGFFLLLYGDQLLDQLFPSIGIPSFAFVVATSLGLVLLFVTYGNSEFRKQNWLPPMIWLLLVSIVLTVFYGLGPLTEYSNWKLIHYHKSLIIGGVAFIWLMSNKGCDLWQIGILLVVAVIIVYASDIYFYPAVAPDNIFSPAGTRTNARIFGFFEEVSFFKRTGMLASMGAVCMLCSIGSITLSTRRAVIFILFFLASMLILSSTGQRLFIINVLIAGGTILFCKPKNKGFFIFLVALLAFSIAGIVTAEINSNISAIDQVLQHDAAIVERMNRGMWYDVIAIIEKQPMLGYGLGGFLPDLGRGYAHNLILELLVETGIVGTAMVTIPVLCFFYIPKTRAILMIRSANNQILFPLLVTLFTYTMISGDLVTSAPFFAMSAVFWAYCPKSA